MRRAACAILTITLTACRAPSPPSPTLGKPDRERAPAAPFSCAGSLCTQRHPRLPDDGEWTCADSAGVTICVGGVPAAGVAPASPDPAWTCGARRSSRDALGARVCRNPSPDFPDGRARDWRCRTLHDLPMRRQCERDGKAPSLADVCDPLHPCVDGARCASGRCALPSGSPDCWLNEDCAGGRCRFAHCDDPEPTP